MLFPHLSSALHAGWPEATPIALRWILSRQGRGMEVGGPWAARFLRNGGWRLVRTVLGKGDVGEITALDAYLDNIALVVVFAQ